MRAAKEPTTTSLVEAVLRATVDFRSIPQLAVETGSNRNQVSAALHCLRKYRVVDVVVEIDGMGWWFALPPTMDTRLMVRDLRRPEVRPRKRRKGKVKK